MLPNGNYIRLARIVRARSNGVYHPNRDTLNVARLQTARQDIESTVYGPWLATGYFEPVEPEPERETGRSSLQQASYYDPRSGLLLTPGEHGTPWNSPDTMPDDTPGQTRHCSECNCTWRTDDPLWPENHCPGGCPIERTSIVYNSPAAVSETPIETGSEVLQIVSVTLWTQPMSQRWLTALPLCDRDDLIQDVTLSCLVSWRKQLSAGQKPKLTPRVILQIARKVLIRRQVVQTGIAEGDDDNARKLAQYNRDSIDQERLIREHAVYSAACQVKSFERF